MMIAATSDIIFWDRFQQGDAAAFEMIFNQQWEPLMRYACSIIDDHALVQDVLQNFFIELWQKRTTLPRPENVQAFLVFILRHRLLNALRSEDIRSRHEQGFAALVGEEDGSAAGQLHMKEVYAQLHHYVDSLPPRMRQVFYMHRIEHKTVAEIASLLNASEQTIRNQLNTATKRLRLQLKSSFLTLFL